MTLEASAPTPSTCLFPFLPPTGTPEVQSVFVSGQSPKVLECPRMNMARDVDDKIIFCFGFVRVRVDTGQEVSGLIVRERS